MEFLLKCTALCMVRQMVCHTTVMQPLSTIAVRLPQNVHTSPIRDSTADRRPASPYTLNEYTLSPIIFSIWYMIFISTRSEFIPFFVYTKTLLNFQWEWRDGEYGCFGRAFSYSCLYGGTNGLQNRKSACRTMHSAFGGGGGWGWEWSCTDSVTH